MPEPISFRLARSPVVQQLCLHLLPVLELTFSRSYQPSTLFFRVSDALARAGKGEISNKLHERLMSLFGGKTLRQRTMRARQDLNRGLAPRDLAQIIDQLMATAERSMNADGTVHERQLSRTVSTVVTAMQLTYHPNRVRSPLLHPLLSDGDAAMLRIGSSPLFRRSPSRPEPSEPSTDRPVHLLVTTSLHLDFLSTALTRWQESPDIEVRVRQVERRISENELTDVASLVRCWLTGQRPTPPQDLQSDLVWADVVYCEWADTLADALSLMALPARTVVRLHKFEALREFVPLMAWENIDQLVIVADHVHSMLSQALPARTASTPSATVPIEVDLTSFDQPKKKDARRTIAMVGYAAPVKDPMWTLDVLELLRGTDPEWRLLLIGAADPSTKDPRTASYSAELEARIEALGDAVIRTGYTTQVPTVLQSASVIISSSYIEGIHTAVAEGVASGCLPVVRNWPEGAWANAAATTYPPDWVVDTPAQAAQRILTASEYGDPSRSTYAIDARGWISDHFAADTLAAEFDRAVLGQFDPHPHVDQSPSTTQH